MQGHRIHVPIQVDSSSVAFVACPSAKPHVIPGGVNASEALQLGCVPLRTEEGLVTACSHSLMTWPAHFSDHPYTCRLLTRCRQQDAHGCLRGSMSPVVMIELWGGSAGV